MRFENDGMALWYGTPDAPAPLDTVSAATGSNQANVDLTVAVQPASASNSVFVRFSINGGSPQTITAAFLQHDVFQKAQYFAVTFPVLQVTDKVDYIAVCQCPGRQVPDKEQAGQLVSSFVIVPAASASKPQLDSSKTRSEVVPSTVKELEPTPRSDAAAAQISLVATASTPQFPEPPASAPTTEVSIEESASDAGVDPAASAATRVDRAEPFPASQPSVGVESNPMASLQALKTAPRSPTASPEAAALIQPVAVQSSAGGASNRPSRL